MLRIYHTFCKNEQLRSINLRLCSLFIHMHSNESFRIVEFTKRGEIVSKPSPKKCQVLISYFLTTNAKSPFRSSYSCDCL